MKIVVDQHIPFAAEVFSEVGEVVLIPGQEISAALIADADALIVRSITQINHRLLGKSHIQFVGSATAGLDHVDCDYLRKAGIQLEHAPGANAESVVEYVLASLAWFGKQSGQAFTSRSIGIVGVGHVGGLLAKRCEALGMTTFKNDPPLESEYGSTGFTPLSELLNVADIVSIHTPLAQNGPFPTAGLIGSAAVLRLKTNAWFVHSARGGVCDEAALIAARSGRIKALALDVWEKEPSPSLNAVLKADISTGHIAGYSLDAKKAGVLKLKADLIRFFGMTDRNSTPGATGTTDHAGPIIEFKEGDSINDFVLKLYPIQDDDARFRSAIKQALEAKNANIPAAVTKAFHTYRATYPVRRRFGAHNVQGPIPPSWRIGLGL